jgi:putative transposase
MHIAWITKYRKKVLKGDIAYRVRDLIRRICEENEVEIIKGAISEDHVHLLVSMKPNLSVSKLVQRLKGKTSHKVQMEHESLRKAYWGRHFWARGYFCVSIGNVNEKMIKEYIEHHFEGEGSSDSFRIEGE